MKKFKHLPLPTLLAWVSLVLGTACNSDHHRTRQEQTPVKLASWEAAAPPLPLTLITGLDNTRLMAHPGATATGYYYIEAKAGPLPEDHTGSRTPLNISLVIDKSGSMAGDKLRHAKQAAQQAIDLLSPDDYVSIVIYGTDVQVIAASNKVGDKEVLKRRIEAIQTSGNTNLSGGMLEGYRQVQSTYHAGYVNRVLLLSDGRANLGTVAPATLEAMARNRNLQDGITLSCFGLGLDFNEDLMTGLAEHGSGNYYFIDHPGSIASILGQELQGLLNVVAQNTELTVFLPTNIVLHKVYGAPYDQVGNRLVVHMRDVMAGESKAILIKFSTFGNPVQTQFHTRLSYLDALAAGHPVREHLADDSLMPTASAAELDAAVNPTIKAQVVLFESNDNLEQAMHAVDAGRYEDARIMVHQNDLLLNQNMGYVRQSAELQNQMNANTNYQQQLQNVERRTPDEMQLLQKGSKSENYNLRKKR